MFDRSLDDYGGAFSDYAAVTDPTTDQAAKFANRLSADAANMIKTAPRAMVRFVAVVAANPTDPLSGLVHQAMWGNASAVKPVVVRTGPGVWTATWPTTVSDDLTGENPAIGGGVSETVNFRTASAQATTVAGVLKHAVAEVTAANVVTIRGFLANGTVDDIAGAVVSVFVW